MGKVGKGPSRVKRPLVARLIVIISVIVMVAMVAVTAVSSFFYSDDARARAEENNLGISQVLASQVESKLRSTVAGALSLCDYLRESAGNPALERSAIADYLDRNAELAYLEIPGRRLIRNAKFFQANELDDGALGLFVKSRPDLLERAVQGETIACNASQAVGVPAAAIFMPYRDLGGRDVMVLILSTEELEAMFQPNSASISYLVAYDGSLVVHPDFSLVKMGASYADKELVKRLLTSPNGNMQLRYRDSDGREYLGAFRKLDIGGLAVTSSNPAALVYKASYDVMRRNLLVTGAVLLLSIMAAWFFSRSVSRPVLALVEASGRIEGGEYEQEFQSERQDELGLLMESFTRMGRGLAERERVKETFGKFVNRDIAEAAIKGQLSLGGTRKTATIFFSDIRSFTAISERLSPEAVVEFLNDYMTRMVHCIDETGGVVDKFIGDAIMGVWGAPRSAGSPADDALAAIRAMVMMRQALLDFNKGRGGQDKPLIHNGCGVNTGACIAGQIGSEKRMEYTVIGDAVNLASRIEALNKPFGTDILISQYTYELVKEQVVVEAMPPIKVKGKSEPLTIYAVIKLKGQEGPETLAELRSFLGIKPPEAAVDVDKEEVKYEVLKA